MLTRIDLSQVTIDQRNNNSSGTQYNKNNSHSHIAYTHTELTNGREREFIDAKLYRAHKPNENIKLNILSRLSK